MFFVVLVFFFFLKIEENKNQMNGGFVVIKCHKQDYLLCVMCRVRLAHLFKIKRNCQHGGENVFML